MNDVRKTGIGLTGIGISFVSISQLLGHIGFYPGNFLDPIGVGVAYLLFGLVMLGWDLLPRRDAPPFAVAVGTAGVGIVAIMATEFVLSSSQFEGESVQFIVMMLLTTPYLAVGYYLALILPVTIDSYFALIFPVTIDSPMFRSQGRRHLVVGACVGGLVVTQLALVIGVATDEGLSILLGVLAFVMGITAVFLTVGLYAIPAGVLRLVIQRT